MTAVAEESKEDKAREKNIATPDTGVKCELDGKWVHSIAIHLKHYHPATSIAEYRMKYPRALLESEYITKLRAARAESDAAERMGSAAVVAFPTPTGGTVQPLNEVLGMKMSKAFQNAAGKPVQCPVLGFPSDECQPFMADTDKNYVFVPDLAKDVLMALVLNKPMLLWGFHGTGKTTLIEQVCARTNRPWMRVQHTVSTEEAHILGQYVVKAVDGKAVTVFEPGPLAYAMKHGLVYCADEYDFALPSVTSVYQPVLEGRPLIIKEAPPEWRVVRPHPNFRFFATGNTNGSGDETGLYQGTQIMNAANYSRFGITIRMDYMEPPVEVEIVKAQGNIHADDARNLVSFAKHVRDAYARGEISVTTSTRELINAAQMGLAKGGDWRAGLARAYINRLSTTDRKAVDDFAQRIFGATRA